MLEIILLSHAKTQAQIKGYFPGNIDLDSNISSPVDFTIPLNDGILCSNFLPAVKTAEHFGVPFIIDKNIPVPDYGRWRGLALKNVQSHEKGSSSTVVARSCRQSAWWNILCKTLSTNRNLDKKLCRAGAHINYHRCKCHPHGYFDNLTSAACIIVRY